MARKGYADVLEKDPTKKVPLEEKIGRDTKKLSESDRRSLENQIGQAEEEMAAKLDMNKDADVSELKRQIDHKKMIVQHDEDLRPKSDTARDRLAARAKEIEDLIIPKMPNKREMWPKTGSVEAQQAVRHNLKFQETYDKECREWQDIQNKLEPDDPNAQSLERIRPD
jgi:hypothetical protein